MSENSKSEMEREIPKAYQPKEVESRWYPIWESRGYFSPDQSGESDAPVFSMVIPPPNVTGYLHMGHALNHTLQDVLARWRRMRGDRVLWLPGTDHAGIATQMVVERQLAAEGVRRQDLGREKFVERVWEWKAHSGGTIQRQMRVLGESVDWSRERFTMDEGLSEAVKEVFVRLHDDGLIYRGEYMVNWSPGLQTAISDLEVEMKPVKGQLYHLAYPVGHSVTTRVEGLQEAYLAANTREAGASTTAREGLIETPQGVFLVVATTRPETMLGDTAVALHPLDAAAGGRYARIAGQSVSLPLVGRKLRLIEDELVERGFGTGFVKVTPAHDPNDFAMGKRHGLAFIQVIGKDARMTEVVPEKYRGLDRSEARKAVLADLDALGLLLQVEPYTHNVGHCQRSGTVVEPLISTQWFLRMKELAEPAIAAVREGRTRFVPDHTAKIYFNWLENIQDWCVSRQLWWGHRIPAWYTSSGEVVVARDEAEARQRLRARGLDGDGVLTEESDVLDTWFSSQLWPFSTLGWPDETPDLATYYPTTVLVTAFDIIFFWVARMMMMGLRFMGEVPFRTVYITAIVLDPEGQKMSKTKGNVVDPLDMFDRYGTDAVRFMLTQAAIAGQNLSMQESKLESARNFTNKIWNATRFVMLNCAEELAGAETLEWETEMAPPELADRWIRRRLERVAGELDSALTGFRFHEAAAVLYRFFWDEFCDWYIELSKPFVTEKEPTDRGRAVKRRIIYLLEQSMRLLHPIMPFITEELWQRLPHRGESVSLATYPVGGVPDADAEEVERQMEWVIELITKLRNIRSTFQLSPAAPLTVRIAPSTPATEAVLHEMGAHIRRLARMEAIEIVETLGETRQAARAVLGVGEIAVPLGGLIDFEKERARLGKELARMQAERDGLEKRLSNPDFLARAAAEVVTASRERAAELEDQMARLQAMIQGL
jgi:valyl-tRNA synthetase